MSDTHAKLVKIAAYHAALQQLRDILEKRGIATTMRGISRGLGSTGIPSNPAGNLGKPSKTMPSLTGNAGISNASVSLQIGDKSLAPSISNPVSSRVPDENKV